MADGPFGAQAAEGQYGDWEQTPAQELSLDVSGGVYSSVEPYFLQPNQLAYLKNANLDKQGTRRKRYGCSSAGAATAIPRGLGGWIDSSQDRYLAGVFGDTFLRTIGDGDWAFHLSTPVSFAAGALYDLVQGEYYDATGGSTSARNALFVSSTIPYTGVTNPHLWIIPETGEATMQASLSPRATTWWQGRLWLGNLSEPDFKPTTLLWSNILDGGTVNTNNTIEIDEEGGDEITALVPARGSTPRLYVFKKHSVWALDVVWSGGVYIPSTENSLDTANSRLVLVSEKVGCVAPKTIVYSSGTEKSDIFFLANDGVRSIRRVEQDQAGGAGQAISEPIRDVIDRINWGAAHLSTAVVHDHKLFLHIPVDGAAAPNLTVIFDLIKKVWAGEYDWAVTDCAVFSFSGIGERMYLQWPHETTEYVGSNATSSYHTFYALDTASHYDPSNTAVMYEEQSRAMVFNNFGQKKRWNWLELMLEPSQTSATLSIYAKVDELDWALINTADISPTYSYPVLPAKLPWAFEEVQPQTTRVGLMDLPLGQRIQFKIETDSPSAFGVRVLRATAWPYVEQWE